MVLRIYKLDSNWNFAYGGNFEGDFDTCDEPRMVDEKYVFEQQKMARKQEESENKED